MIIVRDKIIVAALEEINSVSIKFTINSIVRRLSISKSTFYLYFESKEDLIGGIVSIALDSLQSQKEIILTNEEWNEAEKLEALLIARPPIDVSMRFVLDLKFHFPEEWSKIEKHRSEKWDSIEMLIQKGIKEGCFREIDNLDLSILKTIYYATIKELMDQSFNVSNPISFVDSLNKMAIILCRGIKAQG